MCRSVWVIRGFGHVCRMGWLYLADLQPCGPLSTGKSSVCVQL